MNKLMLKVLEPRIWRRFYLERLSEPIIYNFVSIFVYFFRDFKTKIDYYLIVRLPYAFGIKEAFDIAK